MVAFQSPVRGNEIMAICGLTEGRIIGDIKKDIEEQILEGKIENTHAAAMNYLLEIKNDYIAKDNNPI